MMKVDIGQRSKRYKKEMKVLSESEYQGKGVDVRLSLIEALIPIAMMRISEELQSEVTGLCGTRYERVEGYDRYGYNPGSVMIGGQRIDIDKPRVRDTKNNREIELQTYTKLQSTNKINELVLKRVLAGVSCGKYESVAGAVPEAFGLSPSNISRKFKEESVKHLKELHERDLSKYDFISIWIDGKRFAENGLIVAVGLTMGGEKIVLGLVEAATENSEVVADFLKSLIGRGLKYEEGLLAIVDGSKGLIKAVRDVFNKFVLVLRCNWHKRENIVKYMSKCEQASLRKRLQNAYDRPTYDEAFRELKKIHAELSLRNQSAAASLLEGLEETLTLHRLGVYGVVGKSLKTTNCIESIFSQVDRLCKNVSRWHNSSQRQRWMASALHDVESRLNKVQGYKNLPILRNALQVELKIQMRQAA